MFEKLYELPISKDYVRHWGMSEAIREIIQNALDSDSPFEWEVDKTGALLIKSKNARLEVNTLLLGTTSKSDNKDTIGSFGEGYKIALLVLTRLGYGVTIFNHDVVWTPEFRMSKKFQSEILCILSTNAVSHNEGVTFKIDGLTEEDMDVVKDSCLYMQKSIGEIKHTSKGLILMEKPNQLFIGGLFICKTEFSYGYDIKPEFLSLERDRQTVATFDLKWLIKDMWFEIDDYELVAGLMKSSIPDLDHADYGCTELVRDACYKIFVKENGEGSLIANTQQEMEDMVKQGLTKTVFVGNTVYSKAITSSKSYSASRKIVKLASSITLELEDWLLLNRKHMRRHAIVNFQELITKSINWSKK